MLQQSPSPIFQGPLSVPRKFELLFSRVLAPFQGTWMLLIHPRTGSNQGWRPVVFTVFRLFNLVVER